MEFKIGPYLVHTREQWDLGEKPIICVHKYSDNGNKSTRVFRITRELTRIIKNPFGYCGYCDRYFVNPKRRRRNTQYIEDQCNFMYSCQDCYKEDYDYYQELWDDYWRSRF